MVWGYRYIQIDENGKIKTSCDTPIDGVTIDTEGMTIPEEPTDAIYDLYYNETDKLHWVKAAEFEPAETQPLTEQEQIIIDTALTVEYMACLLEANLG